MPVNDIIEELEGAVPPEFAKLRGEVAGSEQFLRAQLSEFAETIRTG